MNQDFSNRTGTTKNLHIAENSNSVTNSNSIEIPSINLPKGGGAIKGIDEKFSVNAINGTSSLNIPFPVSESRGFSPSLSLTYDSGSGNSIFGMGWSISIPSIKRKTEKELPKYFDDSESDTFLISNSEDLVPEFEKGSDAKFIKITESSYKVKEYTRTYLGTEFRIKTYLPRVEGLFSKVQRWTNQETNVIHWRTISKDNITSIYGMNPESRIADPLNKNKIFEWFLEFTYNDKGSCIYYKYKPEDEKGFVQSKPFNKNRYDQKILFSNTYLKSVFYGNILAYYPEDDLGEFPKNEEQYFFNTTLDYGEHDISIPTSAETEPWDFREDSFSDYRAGFEIRTCRVCKRILHFHNFEEFKGLVRSIDIEYFNNNISGFTFIKNIINKGYIRKEDGSLSQKSLPPVSFEYQTHEWNDEVENIPPDSLHDAPIGIDESQYHFIDLYSEGISGILSEQSPGWFYKSNLGSGNFSPAKLISPKPSFEGLQNQVSIMDLESNGIKQLVQWNNEPKGYFELEENENWQTFKPFKEKPNINRLNGNMRMLDLTGDGLPDILLMEDEVITWYQSKGKDGFHPSKRAIKNTDEEKGPRLIFSDESQTVFLADMSGDGLTDLVRIRSGEVCYWPNLGFCNFGSKIEFENSPVFDSPDQFNPFYLKLADIDGSGTTDIIYLGKNEYAIYLNQNGNNFLDKKVIQSIPEINSNVRIDIADILGTGLSCIIWNSNLPKHSKNPLRYIDLMKSKKPHIMKSYKNNMGKEVSIEYTTSTKFYIEDKISGKPWITKLHFPVQCISKTETFDKITGSKFVNSYKYHHGYYDHEEKEFRGFGMVEQIDSEDYEMWKISGATNIVNDTLHQKPVKTISWAHTGSVNSEGLFLKQYSRDYWYEVMRSSGFDTEVIEYDLPDARMISGTGMDTNYNFTGDEKREAYRACKGMSLRNEMFALDAPLSGATKEEIKSQLTPYTVSSHNCIIEMLQPKGQNKHAVFIVKESEAITYNYERNLEDPRISHNLNIKVDDYGNILESASVVYPRKVSDTLLPLETQNAQAKTIVTYIQNNYTNDVINEDVFRQRMICKTKNYEIKGLSRENEIYLLSEFTDVLTTSNEVDYSKYYDEPNPGTSQRRLIEHNFNLYYKNDLKEPLSICLLESYGILFENYQLAYTQDLVHEIFDQKVNPDILNEGKYFDFDNKWWVRSGNIQYLNVGESINDTKKRFFRPISYLDPYLWKTKVKYVREFLLLSEIEDAKKNKTIVDTFNLRTLMPQRITDENVNISEVLFDELGLVKAFALFGKGNEADDLTGIKEYLFDDEDGFLIEDDPNVLISKGNDLLIHSTARFIYDFNIFMNSGEKEPIVAASIVREEHYKVNQNSKIQLSFEYTNGLGQVSMKKVQAEPGLAKKVIINPDNSYEINEIDTSPKLRWVGNGRTVVNNKGNPVIQYEPYFSVTHKYECLKELVENGAKLTFYYDPLSRLVKKEFPDETYSETKFDSWKQIVYDQNDTILKSLWYDKRINHKIDAELIAEGKDPNYEYAAAERTVLHNDTSITYCLDTLARQVLLVENNGINSTGQNILIYTFSELDIEGNLRSIKDNRGNIVMKHKFDMLGNTVYQNSMDSGKRWMLLNIMGNPLRTWDQRDHTFLFEYDELHRLIKKKVQGGEGQYPHDNVYEKIIYGEDLNDDILNNLRKKVVTIYDTAGKVEMGKYDFKGNILNSNRKFALEYKKTVNWNTLDNDSFLEQEDFKSTFNFDALNRTIFRQSPDETEYYPSYNEATLLDKVEIKQKGLTKEEIIKNIDYNEKGQRNFIKYGNNVSTNYKYDKRTFRLIRLKSQKGNNESLQDLNYTYDPVGNITHIEDRNIPRYFFNNQMISGTSTYTYDPLYRLIEATGREHIGQACVGQEDNWNDYPFMKQYSQNDEMAWRNYIQKYLYDSVGNILQMNHVASIGNWTRNYEIDENNNRLKATHSCGYDFNYAYHQYHGFMTSLPHLQVMDWNFKDELQAVAKQRVVNGIPETTYYVYDSQGERVRKITENSATNDNIPSMKSQRKYIDELEVYQDYDNSGDIALERITYHVMDDKRRFAMIETRTEGDDDSPERLIRYQLENHLSSSVMEISESEIIISYEEYHPYGTTSYQAMNKDIKAASKRYRFTGKERDDESGFNYHSARYYLPWLGRWLSPDPIGLGDGINLYVYSMNNPLKLKDENGKESAIWDDDTINRINSINERIKEFSFHSGEKVMDMGEKLIERTELKNNFAREVVEYTSIVGATTISTAIQFTAGFLMSGPNLISSLDSSGKNLGEGLAKVQNDPINGIEQISIGVFEGAISIIEIMTMGSGMGLKESLNSKGNVLKNKKFGKDFEKIVSSREKDVFSYNAKQVTIRPNIDINTPGGKSTNFVIDNISQSKLTNNFRLIEAKSTEFAKLTKNQIKGFELLYKYGGTIQGRAGTTIFQGGMKIPSGTKVNIIRQNQLLREITNSLIITNFGITTLQN